MADRWGGAPSAVLKEDMRGAVARPRTPRPVTPATPSDVPDALLHAHAVLDDDVHALQEIDVGEHVATDGDDVGQAAGGERAEILLLLEEPRRPARRPRDGLHRGH